MAFKINTDIVLPVSENMKSISTKASEISSNVSSYSIDNTEFNFSGAKDAIVNNVKGMEIKIKNSSTLLNAVVGSHVDYQSSAKGDSNNSNSGNSNNNSSNYYNYGGNDTGGNTYYGGGGTGSPPASGTLFNEPAPTPTTNVQNTIKSTEEQSLLVASMLGNDVKSNIILQTLANTLNLYGITLAETNKMAELLKQNQKLVLLEGISTEIETIEYTRVVGKVCSEHEIPVKYVSLDKILEYKESEPDEKTASISAKSTVSSITSKYTEEKEDTSEEETLDKDGLIKKLSEADKEDEEKESVYEKSDDEKDEIKDDKEKKPEDAYEVKDEEAYKELQNLQFKKNVKNDLTDTPVTLLIKNCVVVGALNGVVTAEELKAALQSAGLITK